MRIRLTPYTTSDRVPLRAPEGQVVTVTSPTGGQQQWQVNDRGLVRVPMPVAGVWRYEWDTGETGSITVTLGDTPTPGNQSQTQTRPRQGVVRFGDIR